MKNFKQLFLFLVIILVGGTGGYYYRGSGGDAEIPAGVVRLLKCFVSIGIIACAYIYIAYTLYISVGTNGFDDSNSVNSHDITSSIDEFLKKI